MIKRLTTLCLLYTLISPSALAGTLQSQSIAIGATSAFDLTYLMSSGSPILSAGLELGGESLRLYAGLESSPLLVHSIGYTDTRPLIALTLGPTVGRDDLRVGAYGSLGFLTMGGGMRAIYTPVEGKRGARHGWEVRAGVHLSKTVSTSLLYHVNLPNKQR